MMTVLIIKAETNRKLLYLIVLRDCKYEAKFIQTLLGDNHAGDHDHL